MHLLRCDTVQTFYCYLGIRGGKSASDCTRLFEKLRVMNYTEVGPLCTAITMLSDELSRQRVSENIWTINVDFRVFF